MLYTFIGFESAPAQTIEDVFLRTRNVATLVGVLDADNEIPSVLLGKKVVVEDGPHPTQVKASGGTRRKTDADFFGHAAKITHGNRRLSLFRCVIIGFRHPGGYPGYTPTGFGGCLRPKKRSI